MTKGYQLINTIHFPKTKDNGQDQDKIVFVKKDKDGNKEFHYVEDPVIRFYVNKKEFEDLGDVNFISVDQVDQVTCRYNDLMKNIVHALDDDQIRAYYNEVLNSGENIRYKLNRLHLDYRIHGSDKNIVDFYITTFLNKYPSDDNMYGQTKAFIDIEVDGSEIKGFPKPELAEAPVNVITIVFDDGKENSVKKVISLCLKYDTETYKSVMDDKRNFENEFKERYNDLNLDLDIREFNSELDLLKEFFNVINKELKPDYVLAWNASFDYVTIVNRIRNLGGDPLTICCPEELYYKKININLDTRNSDPCDRSDIFEIAGYSNWLDQMCLYANLRKANKEESYSLDYIGGKLLGIHKDDVEGDIKTFHFTDYRRFLMYNIQDTVMLYQIEHKNQDVDLVSNIASMTETRITHALKKTVCLRNLADKIYREKNLIISNNRAKLFAKEDGVKIKGAFVGDPNNTEYNGIELSDIHEQKSKFIYESVIDFDLSSLYPSIIITYNISPETCIGKIEIDSEIGDAEAYSGDIMSGDIITLCTKWFNVPSPTELIRKIKSDPELEASLR